MKTQSEITRIARCGGLNKLDREQRRYARHALQTMFDHGGMIHAHRCLTNVRVLALTDFLYGSGRIIGFSGTVNRGYDHGWCEIEGVPFEISYPLVDSDTERASRELTLEQMSNYKKAEEYDYSKRTLPECAYDVAEMMSPSNGNLPTEGAAKTIIGDLVEKRSGTSASFAALYPKSARALDFCPASIQQVLSPAQNLLFPS